MFHIYILSVGFKEASQWAPCLFTRTRCIKAWGATALWDSTVQDVAPTSVSYSLLCCFLFGSSKAQGQTRPQQGQQYFIGLSITAED